jgi:Fic family protein
MAVYIHQRGDWPRFRWDTEQISGLLGDVRNRQGRLLGRMESLGFSLQDEASLRTLTVETVKSSEIEGEILSPDSVRSSIARRLGLDTPGMVTSDRYTDGIVEMMLDATQQYRAPLTEERLFGWHAALFPIGWSGSHRVQVGSWRTNAEDDPMQVVSGPMHRPKVHFEAPEAARIPDEMHAFLSWFNADTVMDPVLKAAMSHLWFVTIHPFEDGNGRIARALTELLLSRADDSARRFYSMSAQIRKERNAYYEMLEQTQKGDMDITDWLQWFLSCLQRALLSTDEILGSVLRKARFWERFNSVSLNDRQRLMLNKLLDGFEGKLTSSKWATIAKCSSDTAVRDINDLLQKNVLVRLPGGGRSVGYGLGEFDTLGNS